MLGPVEVKSTDDEVLNIPNDMFQYLCNVQV